MGGIFNWLRSELKLHNLLCEGGGRLAMSLLTEELVDEFWLFLAPKVLGDEHGKGLASGREVARMDQAGQLRYTSATPVGEDILLTLKPMI